VRDHFAGALGRLTTTFSPTSIDIESSPNWTGPS